MPAARYILSQSQIGAPGVYVLRTNPTPPIVGTAPKRIGFVCNPIRGPVDVLVECDSYARFAAVFGERDQGSGGPITNDGWLYLLNKPFIPCAVVRAAAAAAVKASYTARSAAGGGGSNIIRIDASSVGFWGNNVLWKVLAASDGNSNHFNLEIKYLNQDVVFPNIDVSATGVDTTAQIIGNDFATLITVTKLANGRPVNSTPSTDGADSNGFIALGATNAGYTSVAGADGSIADSDYTGTGGPMEVLNNYQNAATRDVAGRSTSAIKAKILTLAASTHIGQWLMRPDSVTTPLATAITEVASNRDTQGRIIYCFDSPLTLDPSVAQLVNTDSTSWMAFDLAPTDADVHPGVDDNAVRHAAIVALQFPSLADADYDSADAAGICAMELRSDASGNESFGWVSGVTTSLDPNTRQITDVRIADFLISGAVARLTSDKYRPNTESRRSATKGAISAWLASWAKQERYVAMDDSRIPQFVVANGEEVNTKTDQAKGIQKTLLQVTTIANQLVELLLTQIGSQVTVQVNTAAP